MIKILSLCIFLLVGCTSEVDETKKLSIPATKQSVEKQNDKQPKPKETEKKYLEKETEKNKVDEKKVSSKKIEETKKSAVPVKPNITKKSGRYQ